MDTEKIILKAKAHDKLLSSVSGKNLSGGGSASIGGGLSQSKSARSKHIKKQCELYQKQRKAKKTEQRKQAKAKTKAPSAAGTPPKAEK